MNASISRLATVLVVVASLGTASVASGAPRFLSRNLFAPQEIQQVSVSPSGDWVAALASKNEMYGVIVQRYGRRETLPIYTSPEYIYEIQWVGERTLFVRHSTAEGLRVKAMAFRLAESKGKITADSLEITARGNLVDPLPDEDEIVLWGHNHRKGSMVRKGPISAVSPSSHWKLSGIKDGGKMKVITKLRRQTHLFIADRNGLPRASLSWSGRRRPERVVMYRASADDQWREIWRAEDDEDVLRPQGFTADGERLLVLAYGDHDTLGLHEFDTEKKKLGRTVLALDHADINSVIFDYTGKEIVAVSYLEGGQVKHHYLNDFSAQNLAEFVGHQPGETVRTTSSSRDYRFFSIIVYGARNPGTFYFFDKQTGRRTKLGELIPGIPSDQLIEIQTIDIVAPDGTKLEGFLALPETSDGKPPPLLVMPHGGPIAVQDSQYFDPLVQYLALDGIAVLKVNYRGSAGYGKLFKDAGKQQWAGLIEDDINAGVNEVIARGLVDPDRLCIAGGSYGGFSALVSSYRYPNLYRCAATINGVTDVPLVFQSTDTAFTGREAWTEIIGDIEEDYDRLIEISPVYQAEKFSVPVLIIHGSEDERVPPDHAYRLRAMLEAYDKPHDWLEIRGMAHAPDYLESRSIAAKLRGFLNLHLKPGP